MYNVVQSNEPLPLASCAIEYGEDAGLVAIGWDMGPERLLEAYRKGVFPWTYGPVTWWSPDPRAILEPTDIHLGRSFKRFLRKNPFEIRINTDFKGVMLGCAEPAPGRESTWISEEFVSSYSKLHDMGWAHSVECFQDDRLVGGIYGVSIGGYFCGESMFHRESNGAKVALFALTAIMRELGMGLLDIQMLTPITEQLGGIEIDRQVLLKRLGNEIERKIDFKSSLNFPLIPLLSRLL
jgi:leucyl/phenylalanyl-tRNA--protein transferase